MSDTPDMQRIADVLRQADFVLNRAHTSLIAFCDRRFFARVEGECARIELARKAIGAELERLPPPIPMTPEREAQIGALLAAVLDKRFGDGTDEDVQRAFENLDGGHE